MLSIGYSSAVRDFASKIGNPLRKRSRFHFYRIVEPLVLALRCLRWCQNNHAALASRIEASAKRQAFGACCRLDLASEDVMRSARWRPRLQCRPQIAVI